MWPKPGLLLCIALMTTIGAGPLYAQRETDPALPGASTEITGQIRIPDRSIPLSNILIRLESSGTLVDQTTSDGNGRFRFSRLKRGTYTVVVKASGFLDSQQNVDLLAVTNVHILLELVAERKTRTMAPGTIDAAIPAEALKKYQKGESDWRAKKPARAIEALKEATKIYDDYFDAHLLLGLIYREAQQWGEARVSLQRALELNPKSLFALVELGEVYRRQKQYSDAESRLRQALTIDDSAWQAHFTLARVLWETGNPAKAEPFIARAVSLNPEYAEAHLLWGNVGMRLTQYEAALREYEAYLRLAPKGEFALQTREIVEKLKAALNSRKPTSKQ